MYFLKTAWVSLASWPLWDLIVSIRHILNIYILTIYTLYTFFLDIHTLYFTYSLYLIECSVQHMDIVMSHSFSSHGHKENKLLLNEIFMSANNSVCLFVVPSELCVMTDITKRQANVRALTSCRLYSLSISNYEHVSKLFPKAMHGMETQAQQLLQDLKTIIE